MRLNNSQVNLPKTDRSCLNHQDKVAEERTCFVCLDQIELKDECFFPRCNHPSHNVHYNCMKSCFKTDYTQCMKCHPDSAKKNINEKLKQNILNNALITSLTSSATIATVLKGTTNLNSSALALGWTIAEATSALLALYNNHITDTETWIAITLN